MTDKKRASPTEKPTETTVVSIIRIGKLLSAITIVPYSMRMRR